MALIDIGNICNASETDNIFVRFQGSCLVAAKDIKAEDPGTPNHEARVGWADAMIGGDLAGVRQRVAKILRYSISTNTTFQQEGTAINDAAIDFMVAGAVSVPGLL